jgi:hypothetical protein
MRARAEFRNWTPEGWRDAIDLSGNLEEDVAEGVRFARRAIEREKKTRTRCGWAAGQF